MIMATTPTITYVSVIDGFSYGASSLQAALDPLRMQLLRAMTNLVFRAFEQGVHGVFAFNIKGPSEAGESVNVSRSVSDNRNGY